jgi:alanine dehydrogenase
VAAWVGAGHEVLIESGCVAIGHETVPDSAECLSLLMPLSEEGGGKTAFPGRAKYLERPMMGCGVLFGGVPGVRLSSRDRLIEEAAVSWVRILVPCRDG